MSMKEYLPYLLATILPILAFGATYFGFIRSIDQKIADSNNKIAKMEGGCEKCSTMVNCIPTIKQDVQHLKDGMDIFWKVMDPHLAQIIHSPIHVDRDALMDKFERKTISWLETGALEGMLMEAFEQEKDPVKRLAFAFSLARVQMVRADLERKVSDHE